MEVQVAIEIERMITDIEEAVGVGGDRGGINLNSWEEDFFDSIKEQFDISGELTEKQREKLTQIWDRI